MRHPMLRFAIVLSVLTIVTANAARADKIDFTWQSSFSPSSISADQLSGGSLGLVPLVGESKDSSGSGNDQYAVGATYRPTAFVQAFSTFTNQPFALTLKLTDGPSGLSDALTFHGTVDGPAVIGWGTLAGAAPSVSFADGVRSVTIGQDIYHVQMLDGFLDGIGSDPYPDIFAKIDVSSTPEPSTLLLAAMALPMWGFTRRKKRAAPTSKS